MPGGLHPPPSVIASWPRPNYVDPVTEGPALEVVGILFASLATILVAARLYSRVFITQAPGLDDFLILLGLLFAIALTVLVIIGNKVWGSGRHIWDVPVDRFVGNRVNVWISEWCYIISTCSIKISVLLFYRRLSGKFTRAFVIATWIGIIYNILYMIAFLLVIGLSCRPLKAYWMQFDPTWVQTHHFTCINEKFDLPFSAGFSVVSDFYATALPLLLIGFLDLPTRQKLALYPLFAIGFIVVAAGIIRTYFLNYLINETYDNTWYLWKFWIWTFVELYLAIAAASAPALKPFFRRYFVEPISSRRQNSPYVRSSRAYSPGGKRHILSNDSSTVHDGGYLDVEKIGMAVGGEGPMRYELKTLPSGRVEAVPVHLRTAKNSERAFNNQEESVNTSWNLAPSGSTEDSCPLRAYRAEIEALPPVPTSSRKEPVMSNRQIDSRQHGARSVTPDHKVRKGQPGSGASMARCSPQPNLRTDVGGGGSRIRHQDADSATQSSRGSVKAARLRAQSGESHPTFGLGPNGRRNMNMSPTLPSWTQSSGQALSESETTATSHPGRPVSELGDSSETLHLPRQSSIDGNDDVSLGTESRFSLHLPRQGSIDDDEFTAGLRQTRPRAAL